MGFWTRSRDSSPSRRSTYSTHSRSSRHHASTSHYKRRPRDGYIAYLWSKLRHFWRQLMHYARKHPFKVFFMVIMPLVSGGVLHKLARQFGVTLPGEGMVKGAAGHGNANRGGYYGSDGYGEERGGGGGGGLEGIVSGMSGLASMAKMAQAFM